MGIRWRLAGRGKDDLVWEAVTGRGVGEGRRWLGTSKKGIGSLYVDHLNW